MISKLPTWHITNKRVILRADLNVPLDNGHIIDDTRLQAIKPTLDLILQKGGHCVLLTHIGKPTYRDPNLSTQHLISWFQQNNYAIKFAQNIEAAHNQHDPHARITLLENLRFFEGEQNKDLSFAQELATLGDYYVNDAFGTLHRADTSITLLPSLFSPDRRTIGLLIEKELRTLDIIRKHPDHPFVLILGGSKAATKIPLIESLTQADIVLLCPALSFTFAKAVGTNVGKSLVDDTMLTSCLDIIKRSKQQNKDILLPIDYQIAYETIKPPFAIVDADTIPDNGIGISVGPKTIELFKDKIRTAKTIFFNGAPGFIDQPETLEGAKNLLHAIAANAAATTIISGGDSIAVAHSFGLLHIFTHVSTGGGSTLTYLSGQPLIGLEYI
jgi:phosphoglycerate kinase